MRCRQQRQLKKLFHESETLQDKEQNNSSSMESASNNSSLGKDLTDWTDSHIGNLTGDEHNDLVTESDLAQRSNDVPVHVVTVPDLANPGQDVPKDLKADSDEPNLSETLILN